VAVGTGNFLGLAILAVVLLYGQMKDRWWWGRIAKWAGAIIVTPVVIGAAFFGYAAIEEHWRSRRQLKTAFSDGAVRIIRYSQFNATYLLQQRRVYGLRFVDEAKFAAEHAKLNAPKLPAICAGAKDADECAEFLERDGKNPFDAYGYANQEPPPCKTGAADCKPWERVWPEKREPE
jgi:hypothetical protein